MTTDRDAAAQDVPGVQGYESALAEVAQRFPALATETFPRAMLVTVPMFMRHVCRADPGVAPAGSDDDFTWMARLAGGIEGGLRLLAASETGDPLAFLEGETDVLFDIKLGAGPAFTGVAVPLVRRATTWGDRPWPKTHKDQVAVLAEYLAKDPEVVPALIAVIVLGIVRTDARVASARMLGRRLDQADRALLEYFHRRGCRTYCDLVRETAVACHGPGFEMVTVQLLKVASDAVRVAFQASSTLVSDVAAALKDREKAKGEELESITALRHERDRAVAAARKEGMATAAERVRVLEAQVRELEGQLDTIRRRTVREKAYLEEQRARAESKEAEGPAADIMKKEPSSPPAPPVVPIEPSAAERPSLAGRRVFLFTNKKRGGAREAFYAELEALGAREPKVYETKGAAVPGPKTFPPGSVVIVDTSFMSHSFSGVIGRRARAGDDIVLIEDRIGVGGLEQRLAKAMGRQAGSRGDSA